jgi:hypothetical protein
MAWWAEGRAGGGDHGDLDRAGTGPAHGPGGAGEGAAGGGDVVDHQDPAAGEAAPAAGRRPVSDPRHHATDAIGFIGIAASAAEVPTGRGSEQGDQGHVEGGGDTAAVWSAWSRGRPRAGRAATQVTRSAPIPADTSAAPRRRPSACRAAGCPRSLPAMIAARRASP